MTQTSLKELQRLLLDYYQATLDEEYEQPLWDRIGISHYTYLKFMNGAGLKPHLKTMIKIKRFLESNKRKGQA